LPGTGWPEFCAASRGRHVLSLKAVMAEYAIHPPVHVLSHPDEPIRSVEAAAKFIERYMRGRTDAESVTLVHRLERVNTSDEADAAGRQFRQWAEKEHLLLVPPD
jgi:divalent metal cation (Fe/Co/Zn/Cd) transporter